MKRLLDSNPVGGLRLTPEERRSGLIDAALRSIIKHGQAGLSVRAVCQEAGVSAGLLTHHFPGKDALIVEAYRKLTEDIYTQINETLEAASGSSSEDKLRLFIELSFKQPVLDADFFRIWLVFWNLSQQQSEIAKLRDEVNRKVVISLQALIEGVAEEAALEQVNFRLAAIGLSGLMDGLWLEWSLNTAGFSPEEATEICQCWVDALLSGALRRLSSGASS